MRIAELSRDPRQLKEKRGGAGERLPSPLGLIAAVL